MSRLLLNGPINNLSYGLVTTNILAALQAENIDVALFPIGPVECEDVYKENVVQALQRAQDFDFQSPCLRIFHQFSMAEKVGHDNEYFGFPIFELDTLTKLEQIHLEIPDDLFVCSHWAKKILNNHHFGNVTVAPLGVDQRIFKPPVSKYKSPKTIFYMGGKFEKRKCHDIVVECFNKAFETSSNVELWAACHNPFMGTLNNIWKDYFKNSKLGSKIKIIEPVDTQAQLAYLMGQASYGISLSRAEGWDLPLLEMMALGIPSIVSNVTAHTEFANNDNSFLVEMPEKELAQDEYFFKPGPVNQGNWASITESVKDDIISKIRLVHRMYQQDQLAEKSAECLKTANKFTWANTARTLVSHIFD